MTRLLQQQSSKGDGMAAEIKRICKGILIPLAFVVAYLYFRKESQVLTAMIEAFTKDLVPRENANENDSNHTSFIGSTIQNGVAPVSALKKTGNPWKDSVPLRELSGGQEPLPNCTHPYVAVSDILVDGDPFLDIDKKTNTTIRRKIPKYLHFAWVSPHDHVRHHPDKPPGRCLHYLQARNLQRWHKAFPDYSIFFHDDDAVDRLLQQENWPEFPQLNTVLKCAKMRGAMIVDIWRILVLYRYGGMYYDADMWPQPHLFNSGVIPPEVDFFAFSDGWTRPTQGLMATSPGNPIAYHTMEEILKRIWELDNLSDLKLVFISGPEALKMGYGKALGWGEIFGLGTFVKGPYNTTIKKLGNWERRKKLGLETNAKELVTVEGKDGHLHNITVKEKIEADTGTLHWQQERYKLLKKAELKTSCREYLYKLEREKEGFPKRRRAR